MISATDLKIGRTVLFDDKPYRVLKYSHQKIARGGGTVKVKVRNLINGSVEDKTLPSSHRVAEIATNKRPLQFLYADEDTAVFMDERSFEQIEIPMEVLAEDISFVKPGENSDVLFWEDKPLSVDIPPKVTLKVLRTDPGVKGDSATNIYKPAKLENGITLKIPLFVNEGDSIIVDTRTGEYVERAK